LDVRASFLLLGLVAGCARTRGTAPAPSSPRANILTAEDIARSPGLSLEQLLVARVPGVTLTRAEDGRLVLHIRGTTTIHGAQDPLVVVDGIPLEPNPAGNLSAVNPYDIATLEVLRDAAGTAMYGVRGSNGVIVIKTKQPPQ
jgi:iron complex outermembrane receptor protein